LTDQMQDAAGKAGDAAKGATESATGTIREQAVGAFANAAREIIGPAIAQMSQQAATQAAEYAKEQGPKLVKEQVLPQVMKSAGVDNPADLAKAGIGQAGKMMSGAGGITGIAGKIMGRFGKGGKKGVATGYGQGRRIMVQQVQYVPVNVKDVYRAWTSSEWPEYMHRVNTLDRQVEDEIDAEARYAIGVKGLWFKKSFTAQVQEQVPFKFIVWSTTQGNIKNTGRVSFLPQGDDLTLMVLNLDMAPSGLREKWVRGFRYHKRAIRSDFHRFAAWVQMRTQEQLDDVEGWLGTIEGGKVVQTHEEYVEEHEEEQDRGGGEEPEDDGFTDDELPEPDPDEEGPEPSSDYEFDQSRGYEDTDEDYDEEEQPDEEDEDEQDGDEEEPQDDEEDDEPEEEPEPKPKAKRKPKPKRRPARQR
jgi:uncharacterized membrane protein